MVCGGGRYGWPCATGVANNGFRFTALSDPVFTPPSPLSRRAGLALVLCALTVSYLGALRAPFIFDDIASIAENPTLRQLWPPGVVLRPPVGDGFTVAGRPLLNLSFALNYAAGGLNPAGYRAVNIALHAANVLLWFGLLRRTLRRARTPWVDTDRAALAATALWALHPLATESVTYIAQRAESFAAFFCLVTLTCVGRAAESVRPHAWTAVGVAACALGMMVKETVAVTPLLVLLYDRTFLAGTFREAWRQRRALYLGLAATWALLAALVLDTGNRGGSTAAGHAQATWHYLLTQCGAIWHYLRLAVWPRPLVFDYGIELVTDWTQVAVAGLALLALLGATVWALVRRPAAGFLGAGFFLWLAPSSSVIPVLSQTMAEHRMYLPLAFVLVPVVLGAFRWWPRGAPWVCGAVAVVAAVATGQRNQLYRDAIALWRQTAAERPQNARAHENLGSALLAAGEIDAAGEEFATAIELQHGDYADALNGLGLVRLRQGRVPDAVVAFQDANRRKPEHAAILANLGSALARSGRLAEALAVYRRAADRGLESADLHYNWGNALIAVGQLPEAAERFRRAVALRPEFMDARVNLGIALTRQGRTDEAGVELAAVLRAKPDDLGARLEYVNALLGARALDAAIEQLEIAATQQPALAALSVQLGHLLLQSGRAELAAARYRQALQIEPSVEAHQGLARALAALGRRDEAIAQDEAALRLQPDFAPARRHLEELRRGGP